MPLLVSRKSPAARVSPAEVSTLLDFFLLHSRGETSPAGFAEHRGHPTSAGGMYLGHGCPLATTRGAGQWVASATMEGSVELLGHSPAWPACPGCVPLS